MWIRVVLEELILQNLRVLELIPAMLPRQFASCRRLVYRLCGWMAARLALIPLGRLQQHASYVSIIDRVECGSAWSELSADLDFLRVARRTDPPLFLSYYAATRVWLEARCAAEARRAARDHLDTVSSAIDVAVGEADPHRRQSRFAAWCRAGRRRALAQHYRNAIVFSRMVEWSMCAGEVRFRNICALIQRNSSERWRWPIMFDRTFAAYIGVDLHVYDAWIREADDALQARMFE
jgi:hypothetical protein